MRKAVDGAADQSAIVTVKVPEPLGRIYKLVYSDDVRLHLLHHGSKVSLFSPSTKEFILLEALQDGKMAIHSAISPNADYIAFLRYVGERGNYIYETIVKGKKPSSADLKRLFGYETDKKK